MAIKMNKKKGAKAKKIVKKSVAPKKSAKKSTSPKKQQNFTIPSVPYIEAVGRRKVATSRVRIYEGKGDFIVNNMAAGEYFANVANAPKIYNQPFELTGTKGKFAVTVQVSGSGINAQLGAVTHALSRALIQYNPSFRTLLKPEGLLTRDDRMKETRKIGMGGKARRKRQSPKR